MSSRVYLTEIAGTRFLVVEGRGMVPTHAISGTRKTPDGYELLIDGSVVWTKVDDGDRVSQLLQEGKDD
jgi:hypothetical protein